jgi:hypothetical protein
MSVILECIGCRTEKDFPSYTEFPVCKKCKIWETQHHEELQKESRASCTCSQCGYQGVAIDKHHVDGRKNSKVTIVVCCNCHREIHAGAREII